jgi:hypothetical protein
MAHAKFVQKIIDALARRREAEQADSVELGEVNTPNEPRESDQPAQE